MRALLTKKNIVIALIAVVIAAIAVFSVGTGQGGGFLTEWMNKAATPLKGVAASVARTFETIYGFMYEQEKLVAENEELKRQIADYQQNYREYTDVSEENRRLRELLGFTARHSDFIYDEPATIISWSASNWSSSFTVSRGSKNSSADNPVAVGDAVITETGVLIGRITEVGKTTSTAVSVIDTTFSSGALAGEPGVDGVAAGDFSLMREGKLKLDFLSEDTTVRAGDAVVTSGKSGVLPDGLVIGTVESVVRNTAGLGMYGVIAPAANLGEATY
ncbi:MAG: rod shape-determining protein MreC, partial [Clostridiales bacterium]|nr:rod shape-determining protein MreC [Clostridiales bacterium]